MSVLLSYHTVLTCSTYWYGVHIQSWRSNMSSSTTPFSSSRKVYIAGSSPDISVPMREIVQSPSPVSSGEEENPPVRVYDTSGQYTDPNMAIDVHKSLHPLRQS